MSEERSWDQLTDAGLVERTLSAASPWDREQALKAIYDRHAQDVLGLCGYWLQDPDEALDAAQSTFETAIKILDRAGRTGDPPLRDPDRLGAYLKGIARNKCRAVWRRRGHEGDFPGKDLEEAEHEVIVSRRRQARVDRMLDTVAASLNQRQQRIFQLVLRQGLRGQALAAALGVSEKDANDATYENQGLIADGFGAYVLACDGRRYCQILASILDQAGWDGQTFTRVLRLRVLRHLDNCPKLCDNCGTCNTQKTKLIVAYTPVTIPILIAAELRDRVYQLIHSLCTPPGSADPGQPGNGGPGAAASGIATSGTEASLDADITRSSAAGSGTAAVASRLPAMASAATGPAVADALVTRLQSLVRTASQSSRLPRWLRRAIPPDAGPGTSIAIFAGAIAAVVVIVAVLAAAAAALAPGKPAPQAGQGSTAIAQGGQPPSPGSGSVNPTITGPTYVDSIPGNMLESHVIDVNLVKVVDPAQETNVGDVAAGNGYRLVALVFQIKCISGGEYGNTEVQISTSNGESYSPVIAGIAGYGNADESGVTISAGQTETIVIPYLLPDGVKVTGVEWKPYLHDPSNEDSHGEWTVRE